MAEHDAADRGKLHGSEVGLFVELVQCVVRRRDGGLHLPHLRVELLQVRFASGDVGGHAGGVLLEVGLRLGDGRALFGKRVERALRRVEERVDIDRLEDGFRLVVVPESVLDRFDDVEPFEGVLDACGILRLPQRLVIKLAGEPGEVAFQPAARRAPLSR